MRTILSILAVLVLAIGFASSAFAQADTENIVLDLLAGCDYIEPGGLVTATEDTLFFNSSAPNAGWTSANVDWHPPKSVPVGVDSNGELIKQTRPVKRLVLFSLGAFGSEVFQGGASAPSGGAVPTYLWPEEGAGGEFFLVVDYPDSAHVAGVAAADSTEYWLGY